MIISKLCLKVSWLVDFRCHCFFHQSDRFLTYFCTVVIEFCTAVWITLKSTDHSRVIFLCILLYSIYFIGISNLLYLYHSSIGTFPWYYSSRRWSLETSLSCMEHGWRSRLNIIISTSKVRNKKDCYRARGNTKRDWLICGHVHGFMYPAEQQVKKLLPAPSGYVPKWRHVQFASL
jgi:hypothetical protein